MLKYIVIRYNNFISLHRLYLNYKTEMCTNVIWIGWTCKYILCKTYVLSVGMSCEVECKLELILCYIVKKKKKLPWKTTSNQYA